MRPHTPLPHNLLESVKRHALLCDPQEACGLIVVGPQGAPLVYPCRNHSQEPCRSFKLSMRELKDASRLGTVKWLYHSHTNDLTRFSSGDRLEMLQSPLKVNWLLYNTRKDTWEWALAES